MPRAKKNLISPDKLVNDVELVERIAGVTEELADLVRISEGKKQAQKFSISRDEITATMKGQDVPDEEVPKSILAVFRLLVVKNLIRGRLFVTSYNAGKDVGLSASIRSKKDFIKVTKRLGLKQVEVPKFDTKRLSIKMSRGITAQGVKKSPRPICFFEAGLFAGLMENIFRQKIDLKEVRCKAMGDAYCQFELSKSRVKIHKSHSLYPVDIHSQENLKLLASLASHSVTAIENALLFEKTRKQVIVDDLTQVYNHRYFQSEINIECKKVQRYKSELTLFMLDIDNFKNFNDKYGHPVGDEILQMVASVLVRNVRDVDIVARYGGDEFAIILPQTNAQGANVVAKRIRKTLSEAHIAVRNKKMRITMSIGSVTVGPKSLPAKFSKVVQLADKALLMAKRKGKNNIVLLNKSGK